MTMQTWVTAAGIAAGAAAILAILGYGWRLLRTAWRLGGRAGDFFDDWVGEPSRPGVPARPGVMERLGRIEHEVTTNSGGSLKDAVKRIEDRVTNIEGRQR